MNVRAYLFPDLARALAPGLPETAADLDDLLLEGLLEEKETERGPYAAIQERPGLREALLDAFGDLLEAGIEPRDVERAASRAAREDPHGAARGDRLRELARLYRGQRARLKALGLHQVPDLVREAAERAKVAPLLRAAPAVLVYGFYDLTPTQLALVSAIAGVCPTTLFFPYEDGPAYRFARVGLEHLTRSGFARRSVDERQEEGGGGGPEPGRPLAVELLPRRLFRTEAGSALPDDGSVEVLSCPGEAREALAVGRHLAAEARRSEDLRFERVAVLPRTLAPSRRALSNALAAYGVPAAVRLPLGETGTGRLLSAVLRARASDLGRREVIDLLALAAAVLGLDGGPRTVSVWDRYSRQAGVVSGRVEWDRRLEAFAAGCEEARSRRVRALREEVLGLATVLEGLPQQALPSRFAAAASSALCRLGADGEERTRALDLLAGLALLDAAGREVTLERFTRLVERALDSLAAPAVDGPAALRPLVRGVVVADLLAARGVPFDVVVLPGLVERVFPVASREDPVLPDADRLDIAAAAGRPGSLRTRSARRDEERLLFTLACAAARRKLVLSYPRIEPASGRERVPSSFLLAVAEALTGKLADYRTLADLKAVTRVAMTGLAPADPRDAESALEYDLSAAALADEREVLHLGLRSPGFARGLELDHARWTSTLSAYDGMVGPLYDHPAEPLSSTRLETYAKCPLRYFFRYGLGLQPLEEPERAAELAPRDRGSILHAVLYEFLSWARREGRPLRSRDREALARALGEKAEGAFARHASTGATGAAFVWELERSAIRNDLLRWLDLELEAEGEWVPAFFEMRFGPARDSDGPEDPASSDRSAELALGDGRSFAFAGRIDRIDLSADRRRFRVIDYKGGGLDGAKPDVVRGGRALQLPVYLLAARALLGRLGIAAETGEAQYFFVTRRAGYRRVRFTEENWARKEETLRRVARIVADGIAGGSFHPEPSDRTCQFCDFRRICGSSRERLHELKREDPRRKRYEELGAIE